LRRRAGSCIKLIRDEEEGEEEEDDDEEQEVPVLWVISLQMISAACIRPMLEGY
jgi:hypothetical protein